MSTPFALYSRLPEIHRIRDVDNVLQRFLALAEREFGLIRENIAQLYDDHFIETCADWVIPYIGDLVGASPLSGDPHTLRADVADTVALRRRKGTLGAIELLVYALTRWGAHAVELRERLVWHQHLNHQRPDRGGAPAYGLLPGTAPATLATAAPTRRRAIRGGTVTLRDAAALSLLGGPFDPFAHLADVRRPAADGIRHNLPNLAIFLWRLADYRAEFSQPVERTPLAVNFGAVGSEALFIVRFYVHPMGEPVQLFNAYRFDPERRPLELSKLDETPGPMPAPRLTSGVLEGNPGAYVAVHRYDPAPPPGVAPLITEQGLQLHVRAADFGAATPWTFRGANLCAWETGLRRPLNDFEVAIDPVLGRLAIGVPTLGLVAALRAGLLVTYTYGAAGPIGAHPDDTRAGTPQEWLGEPVLLRRIRFDPLINTLQQALDNIQNSNQPIVVEIGDSRTYDLDLGAVAGTVVEAGGPTLRLNRSLIIRAAEGERPIIRLAAPLRFRPTNVADPAPAVQAQYDAVMNRLGVHLEGLYLTRSAALVAADAQAPIVARAALNNLELIASTLDPAGFRRPDGTREIVRKALDLRDGYGFAPGTAEDAAFSQTPDIVVQRSITGPLRIDATYKLTVHDSIIDGGTGVADLPDALALASASNPANGWGPHSTVRGATFFGRTRVSSMSGCGGIFVHALQVEDTQHGCIKQSYFENHATPAFRDRLPQHYACVLGGEVRLGFTAHSFGAQGYGQLARETDFRVRERGPGDDAMGATGFLQEAHKWRNLTVRFAEFMPVGIRPLLIPVT